MKNQKLEIIKGVHDGTGQCTHTKTMAFHKEIQFIQKFHSGSVFVTRKIINVKTLKALCKSHHN